MDYSGIQLTLQFYSPFGPVCVLSRVRLFVTPWTVAHQPSLSVELSRQELEIHWSGLPFHSPGNFVFRVTKTL